MIHLAVAPRALPRAGVQEMRAGGWGGKQQFRERGDSRPVIS